MSSTLEFRWEWMSAPVSSAGKGSAPAKEEWKLFDPKIQALLTKAVQNKSSNLEFEAGGVKFEVDLEKMVQRNLKTKFERAVRIYLREDMEEDKSEDDDWHGWQWQEESSGRWISYSPRSSIDLENAHRLYKKSGPRSQNHLFKLQISSASSYTVDFKKMSQKNDKSGYSRKVRREMSEITNEEPTEAVNAGPTTRLRKRATLEKTASSASTISISSTEPDPPEVKEEAKSTGGGGGVKRKMSKVKSEPEVVVVEKKEEEEEEENDEPTTSKKTKKSAAAAKSKGRKRKDADVPEEEEEKIVTLKFAGKVPVDAAFLEQSGSSNYRIYSEGNVHYDCMLNQTNLQYNNNKFYIIQLIEQTSPKKYIVWMRWGRVGKQGQTSTESCGTDLASAKGIFCRKFADKTRNDWSSKDSFEKYPGKYDLVVKDYEGDAEAGEVKDEPAEPEAAKPKAEKVDIPASKLDKRVQDLVELVCNVTEMENVLKEMKFDAKKAPLGKLSKGQIKAGYAALKEIEQHIKNKTTSGAAFVQANNDFYTRIPHDFGMRVPPMIRTDSELREKLRLLEVLEEIDVAVKMLNQKSDIVNPVDRSYDQLDCEIKPLDHEDKMFKLIKDYLEKNHAPTHATFKLKLLDVFETRKQQEAERFKDVGNRMLLWHGSRLTNWAGILSQGLRIAPPEAPVTGYMFGKGCYFSDSSSKSANYCYTTSNKSVGVLSLSEVSLGVCNELKVADNNADKLPPGKTSTKGLGKSGPDSKEWVTLEDGCVVPVGKIKTLVKPPEANSYALLYNEFIVYDVAQIKMKYLVKVQFVYGDDEDED